MDITYGTGQYLDGKTKYEGQIILGEHKLFLRSAAGDDIPQTFIPLEKVSRIKKSRDGVELDFRISILERFSVLFKGDKNNLLELAQEIAARRGLRKRFFFFEEWVENPSS